MKLTIIVVLTTLNACANDHFQKHSPTQLEINLKVSCNNIEGSATSTTTVNGHVSIVIDKNNHPIRKIPKIPPAISPQTPNPRKLQSNNYVVKETTAPQNSKTLVYYLFAPIYFILNPPDDFQRKMEEKLLPFKVYVPYFYFLYFLIHVAIIYKDVRSKIYTPLDLMMGFILFALAILTGLELFF